MSTSSNISQTVYSPSESETTPQGTAQTRLQNFDQSLSHTDIGHSIEQSLKSAQNEMHQKRIQDLRKDDDDENESDQENFLAEKLLDLELSNNEEDELDEENNDPQINAATCFQRTGEITYVGDSYVLIDGSLFFDLTGCSVNVYQNDRVSYLYYKNDDNTMKVVRILENLGLSWGDHEVEENIYQVIEHVIIGEVDYREDRWVFMKDNDLKFSLDEVETSFVPMKGDWLELKCGMQWDEEKPSQTLSTQVVKVLSLKALRTKSKSCTITQWDGEFGACDNQIYFSKQSLQNGTHPQVGTKVLLHAIESNQGPYSWRAITLIPDDSVSFVEKVTTNDKETDDDKSLQLEHEKNIEMTHPLRFDNVTLRKTESISLNIVNKSEQTYNIIKWKVMTRKSDSQLFIKPFLNQPVKLYPQQSFALSITCNPKFLGDSKELLVIVFKGFQLKRSIGINVVLDNITNAHFDSNYTTRSYIHSRDQFRTNMRDIQRNGDRNIVPGVRPVRPPNFIPVKLGGFPIPYKIWTALLSDSDPTPYNNEFDKTLHIIEEKLPCLLSELNIHTYTDKWHTLLYMEEVQQNIHMRSHDIPSVFLHRFNEYLSLEIPDLSEKRPSLIAGDRAVVKDTWDKNTPEYEGYIHAIQGNLVLIKFHPRFHESYPGSDVAVQFHFSRTGYRRTHQAINLAISNLGPELLFPSRVVSHKPQVEIEKLNKLKWFNANLNAGQKAAVTNILEGKCRPMPYVIYGPPGTGKTITVIETILQILSLLPDSRILVATPSNSAANLIAERLIQYRNDFSDSVIRLIAHHYSDSDSIPEKIKPFCATLDIASEDTAQCKYKQNRDGINLNCRTNFVGRHRVTIGTCYCLGTLAQMGLPRGHFTHIIIDEAGQATEPEIMIPMTFTDKENGQIILAGDPMQLGPVVMSKYCVEFGMDVSYLSRILERFPYQKDFFSFKEGYDPRLVTKLIDNYRSIEEVLTLPSHMFYDGSLMTRIDRNEEWISRMIGAVSDIFSNDHKTGGIYTFGIRGTNARAEDSPSWFNAEEASMLALTVCKLYKRDITPDDIGVITPYIAQVKFLRRVFDAMGLPLPKIGSVEDFQGQERPIILISTVRSTVSHLQNDLKHTLGFVKNPKRLNVALTRAQVAVILFCNPHLLYQDQLWKQVISMSVKSSKYTGCDLPADIAECSEV